MGIIMEENQRNESERREERRKRRVRNQIMAYLTLIFLIAILATGIVVGVKFIMQGAERSNTDESSLVEEQVTIPEESLVLETTEEVVVELTNEEKLDEIVDAVIEVMPLEDKVAGLFMVTPEAITGVGTAIQAGEGTKDALSQYAIGGLIYFDKNIQSAAQITEMINNTVLYSKYPLFLGIDEEGGSVSRIAKSGIAEGVVSAAEIGASGDSNNAYQAGITIGTYLTALGFNLDFAPVTDISNVDGSVMESRAYGSDAATTIPYVTSMIQGLQESNVAATAKHFPGIGSTTSDTHDGLAVTEKTIEEFRAEEFTVFQAAIDAGVEMVMMGHISAPSLTGDNTPCSLSEAVVTTILREELGYEGIIITDSMSMSAISGYYSADDAAIRALKAGCDMILMPENFETAYNGVLQAVKEGIISEERINDSLRRIYRIKYADKIQQ